jgi:glycosyltransferase involved in cell wall biosynthesis
MSENIFEQLVAQAEILEKQGHSQQTLDIYAQLLQAEVYKEKQGEISFRVAIILFENKSYEVALQMFIKSYNFGYKPQEILNIIDEAYYIPNFVELNDKYSKNIKSFLKKYPNMAVLPFNDLPIKFIPISDKKYYIFNKKSEEFCGSFTIELSTSENICDNERLIIGNEYNPLNLSYYQQLMMGSQNASLYVVCDPVSIFLSYLQVSDLSEIVKDKNIKFLFSLDEVLTYFNENPHYRPTKVLTVEDDRYGLEYFITEEVNKAAVQPVMVEEKLEQDEQRGNRYCTGHDPNILLSFCIPTYNRGQRALASVQHILKLPYTEEIEIIVSDNCSPDVDGYYKELSLIKDSRLKYHRNHENVGFARNWLKIIELAQGKYVYTLSDEDFVNVDRIPRLLELLQSESEIGAIHVSMQPISENIAPKNSLQYEGDRLLVKGSQAVLQYAFRHKYISGNIYNREYVQKNQLFERVWENIDKHSIYPHIYLEALLCTQGNVMVLSDILCLEGEPEGPVGDPNYLGKGSAYSFFARLSQHKLFTEIINEVIEICGESDSKQISLLHFAACVETFRIIHSVNGPYYELNGCDLPILLQRTYRLCLDLLQDISLDRTEYHVMRILIKNEYCRYLAKFTGKKAEIEVVEAEIRREKILYNQLLVE